MRLFLLISFSLLVAGTVQETYAQVQHPDSILKQAYAISQRDPHKAVLLAIEAYSSAKKGNNPKQQLTILQSIAYFYMGTGDYLQAHSYTNKAITIAQNSHRDSLLAELWNYNAYLYHLENKYAPAVANYVKAVPYFAKQKLEKRLGEIYFNAGVCERKLGRFETANTYLFKSADVFLKLKDSISLSDTYNSIGVCFSSLGDNNKALAYHRQSLALRTALNNKVLIAQSANNIGFSFFQNGQPDSAIFYLTKCLSLRVGQKDSGILVLTLQNLGASWKMKGEHKKALNYIQRSVLIASSRNMQEELARGSLDLAELYLADSNTVKAVNALKNAEEVAQLTKLPDLLLNVYRVKEAIYEYKHDYQQALFYSNKKNFLKDSLFTISKNKAISEIDIKYNTKQKEASIAVLHLKNSLQNKIVNQQKFSIIILGVSIVLLMLLLFITFNSFKIKHRANLRIQNLMKELHHRVKNNLQILSGLFTMQIENLSDENTKSTLRENESRLNAMNLIHNKLYLDNTTTQIEIQEYLTKLLYSIKDAFDSKNIDLRIEADHLMIEADKAVAIGLIVNELATNAFKHAFEDNTGEIYFSIMQTGKSKISLTLRDNGKGIPSVHKTESTSFGLKLVSLMAKQLNTEVVVKNDGGVAYRMDIVL
jgi:two-component sensor histidine kinase/Tfp pilus assembly protein PilF